jgi:hypothetical protein
MQVASLQRAHIPFIVIILVLACLLLFEKVIDLHRELLLLIVRLLKLEEQIVYDLPRCCS